MILDSTKETMRDIRSPSDHSAYFGRDAHTNYVNLEFIYTIKSIPLSLRSSYSICLYHNFVEIFRLNNDIKRGLI